MEVRLNPFGTSNAYIKPPLAKGLPAYQQHIYSYIRKLRLKKIEKQKSRTEAND